LEEPRPRASGFFPLWLALILIAGAVAYVVKHGTDVLAQYSSLLSRLEADHQSDRETLANLQQQVERNSHDVALLAGGQRSAVKPAETARVSEPTGGGQGERRVEFELGVNHKKELMPGVFSVQVSPPTSRVSGTMPYCLWNRTAGLGYMIKVCSNLWSSSLRTIGAPQTHRDSSY